MSKHTFEFSRERGITGIGDEAEEFEILPANPDMFRMPDRTVPANTPVRLPPGSSVHVGGVTVRAAKKPLNVIKAAKARRRELKREIARLRKLEIELAELDRLLQAAEQKPCAIVRDIAAKRG